MDRRDDAPVHTINSSLQVQRTSAIFDATKIDRQKAEQITTLIAALSLQYYREGVDPAAAKVIFGAFVEDLADYAFVDIETGVRECRRDPKQKYFPTSGQLRERVQHAAEERLRASRQNESGVPFSQRYAHCNHKLGSPETKAIYAKSLREKGPTP